jgi:superfamily II DNA/RNA helicase
MEALGIDWDDEDELTDDERQQLETEIAANATAAQTISELQGEIERLQQLEVLAQRVLAGETDRKLEELSQLFENDTEMFDAQGNRRKLIIFTEHRDTLEYLVARLSTLIDRQAVVTIHGSMDLEQRQQTQQAFNQNPKVMVLVATDAAGEGINLQQSCHLMVNYDLPWNPNRLEQRFGRIHRIGQTEVCHLWNLVAGNTREGKVYEALLRKLDVARAALGGKVFDVLGEAINGKELEKLFIEAIRYGDRPDKQAELEQAIEERIKQLRELLEKRSLHSDRMNVSKLRQIRDDIERVETRKLQPYFVAEFFLKAFEQLGGRVEQKESGRYRITFTPIDVRHRLPKTYSDICFSKELIHLRNKPTAEFICPGHPLLDKTIELFLERHHALLKQGSILVNENDLGEQARVLVYLEHAIQDARTTQSGDRREASRQIQYVELDNQGQVHNAGYAPYLDYRPLTGIRKIFSCSDISGAILNTTERDRGTSTKVCY